MNICLSLDEETAEMLKEQAKKIHISKSALVRLFLLQNKNELLSAFKRGNDE